LNPHQVLSSGHGLAAWLIGGPLLLCAAFNPAFEEIDFLIRPFTVAGHYAVADRRKNSVSIVSDIDQ
jgi:hypothetical protein